MQKLVDLLFSNITIHGMSEQADIQKIYPKPSQDLFDSHRNKRINVANFNSNDCLRQIPLGNIF